MVQKGSPICKPVKAITERTTEITLNAKAVTRLSRCNVLNMLLPHAQTYLNMVDQDVARATWFAYVLLRQRYARP